MLLFPLLFKTTGAARLSQHIIIKRQKGGAALRENASSLQPHATTEQVGEQWFVCSVLSASLAPLAPMGVFFPFFFFSFFLSIFFPSIPGVNTCQGPRRVARHTYVKCFRTRSSANTWFPSGILINYVAVEEFFSLVLFCMLLFFYFYI